MIPSAEKTYAVNRLLDQLDDAASALVHAEMEVAEAKRRYERVKDDVRKAIFGGLVED